MAKSSEAYIEEILRLLANGIVERGKVLAKVGKKWQISTRTFDRAWKIAQERYLLTQQKLNDKIEATLIQNKTENLSNGLKSKSERLLNLQKQIDNLEAELKNNKMHVHAFSMGEMVIGTREMNSLEKAKIADTIKSLQSEISKIEGDYAPTKQENTIKLGKDLSDESYV
jgi:hypothetical protein